MLSRRVAFQSEPANVECTTQAGSGLLWCGLGNGTLIQVDLERDRSSAPLGMHRARVSSIVSAGGDVWTASYDRTIIVTRAKTSVHLARLDGHSDCITSLTYDSKDNVIYSAGFDGTIIKWCTHTYAQLEKCTVGIQIHSLVLCSTTDNDKRSVIPTTASTTVNFTPKTIDANSADTSPVDNVSDHSDAGSDHGRHDVLWAGAAGRIVIMCAQDLTVRNQISVAEHCSIAECQVAGAASATQSASDGTGDALSDGADNGADNGDAEPPSSSPQEALVCKAIAMSPTGQVWCGGNRFLHVWKPSVHTASPVTARDCHVAWQLPGYNIQALQASPLEDAPVMCAAASDGFVLMFGLPSARPLRRLRCHTDMVLSLAFVMAEGITELACTSAHGDGTISLCLGLNALTGTDRSQFLSTNPAHEFNIEYDYLGFHKSRELRGRMLVEVSHLSFDEEIHETGTFSTHQRCWEVWHMRGNPFEQTSAELQLLCRGGIPHVYRRSIWEQVVHSMTKANKKFLGHTHYRNILQAKHGKRSKAIKQIDLDLDRTFPTNFMFESIDTDTAISLRNVLVAFSWHNPRIGYCQGLNRIAAFSLLILDEETTFWTLVGIVEQIMTYEYYTDPLIVARADLDIFKDLLAVELPGLHMHFRDVEFDIGSVSFQWFFSLFVTCLPPAMILRIWDSFLWQGARGATPSECAVLGREVLFRYSLGILKMHEALLLSLHDQVELFCFFSKDLLKIRNFEALTQAAYSFSPDLIVLIEQSRRVHEASARKQHAAIQREKQQQAAPVAVDS
eukprot:m.1076837 g.1076837  ORF g.1076837 m.1076837 type:complete len:790 (-) comp24249_c0_seq2:909-3278(-)